MASTQNYYDHYIPFFPQPTPHNNHPIQPKVTPPHSSSPSPPNVAPPHRSPPPVPPPGHPLAPPHNFPSPPKVPTPVHPVLSSPPPPPQFPVPATPPTHSFHPPPPAAKPPTHSRPPPTPTVKPPPHPFLPPPSPPSGHHSSTVIVVVFVSLGGLFFLAFLSVALFCFLKKKKKVQKSELVHVDEHVKVEEAIISGPHGEEVKVLSVEEDVHIQEEVDKKSIVEGTHKQLDQGTPQDLKSKASTSEFNHQHHKA